ncbi:unnamed protein product [Peniophora sp. CBMAI 1063]|nr:unnamed protein product [Peniophora sp. CBMAI 1063]
MSTAIVADSSNALSSYLAQLDTAKKAYIAADTAFLAVERRIISSDADYQDFDNRADEQHTQLGHSLGIVCDVVRSASQDDRLQPSDLDTVVERAAAIENTLIDLSFGKDSEDGNTDIVCGNVLREHSNASRFANSVGAGTTSMMMPLFQAFAKMAARMANEAAGKTGNTSDGLSEERINEIFSGKPATPYKDTPKPSPYTSPLARFGSEPTIPDPDATASLSARAFVEARCEIGSNGIGRPVNMLLAGDTLILLGEDIWKDRGCSLSIRDLTSDGSGSNFNYRERTYGLRSDGGPQVTVDGSRKLIYNGADRVINAYRYGHGSSKKVVFALDTKGYQGILGLADDGAKVLRTGSAGLGVWDVSSTSKDGSQVSFTSVKSEAFADIANFGVMAEHPSNARERLVGSCEYAYFVSSVDIDSGRVAARYVGHNRGVTAFASSRDDPHSFVTASSDGGVRFYDARMAAPTYAIQHLEGGDNIQSVLYEHIGGHPFIIIGGSKSQQIKIWDASARAPLYELSTGNNTVEALAWDGSRNQLFAATSCEYLGHYGTAFDYRQARFGEDVPRHWEKAWPKQAYHNEESFGHPFDCGSHRLLCYCFKVEPDTSVLPKYGDAQPDRGGGGFFGGF